MKIQLDRLAKGGQCMEACEPAAQYHINYMDFCFPEPISVVVDAQIVSGNLVVSGRISTKVQMTCSRCLRGFFGEWSNPRYHFDCPVTNPNGIIDLTEHIREDIIVGLPVKPLCRSDCKGLCPDCGIDWNAEVCDCAAKKTDPRWEKLNKLRVE